MSSQLRLTAYAALATMATSTALISVFSSNGWVIPVMGAILIVAGSCALVRSSPLPSAFEPILAAVAILCWITFLDARSKAHFGFIPGRLALRHLDRTARRGFTQIHRLPTPAPPHHGLVLLTVVGVSAIALVVDLMTVTLRRAALSGLPILALFTVCAATGHHGVGLVPFILTAVCYLWLLYADNREKVARWGAAVGTGSRARPASAWSTDESSAPAPASLGRRVGAAAISLGVIVPLFIPGLHTGIDKHSDGGSGTGNGSGNQVVLNPIVSVANDLTSHTAENVISYTSTSTDPGYLRLTSLDVFNGVTFSSDELQATSHSAVSENLPVVAPPGPTVTTTIDISRDLARLHYLPAPATVLGVSVNNAWRYDPGTATIFSATATGGGLQYTTRSVTNDPTATELSGVGPPTAAVDADLTVPASVPASVSRLTAEITSKAESPYEAALDIQSFFTGGSRFTYDTNIPANNSPNALADFLFKTRKGFCQQFATAMAVMARLYGIPSRVAVGFTHGTQQPNGSWLVTTHDAHAWPELYFQGYGWLPFEPTPRGDGQAVTPSYARKGANSGPTPTPSAQVSAPSDQSKLPPGVKGPHGINGGGGAGGATSGSLSSRITGQDGIALLVAVAIVLLLMLPSIARSLTRRRRWRQIADPARAPDAAWAELRDTAIDLHLPWDDGHTPRQIAKAIRTVLGSDPDTAAAIQQLARCEEHSRYAPTPRATATDLRHDVNVVRVAALAKRSRLQQLRARILPRSTLLVVGRTIARSSSVLDGFDRLMASARHAVRTPSRFRSEANGGVAVRP
jgi:transglutaminase-like putative cysteine protease